MDDRTKRQVGFGVLAVVIVVAAVLLLTTGGGDEGDDVTGSDGTEQDASASEDGGAEQGDDAAADDDPTEDPEGDDAIDDAPPTTATPSFTTEVPSSQEELDALTGACNQGDPNACYDVALRDLPRPSSLPATSGYADATDDAVTEACFIDAVADACFEAGARDLPPLPAVDEPR